MRDLLYSQYLELYSCCKHGTPLQVGVRVLRKIPARIRRKRDQLVRTFSESMRAVFTVCSAFDKSPPSTPESAQIGRTLCLIGSDSIRDERSRRTVLGNIYAREVLVVLAASPLSSSTHYSPAGASVAQFSCCELEVSRYRAMTRRAP